MKWKANENSEVKHARLLYKKGLLWIQKGKWIERKWKNSSKCILLFRHFHIPLYLPYIPRSIHNSCHAHSECRRHNQWNTWLSELRRTYTCEPIFNLKYHTSVIQFILNIWMHKQIINQHLLKKEPWCYKAITMQDPWKHKKHLLWP